MPQLHPYLNFNGNCEEAFNHYRKIFGGEFQVFSRFSEMPPDNSFPLSDEDLKNVMHVSLPISNESVLMGSDQPAGMGQVQQGNAISISIGVDTEADADRVFTGLSEGGNIIMPLARTFWNSYFGMCEDRFGIQWMVSHDYSGD